MNEKCIRVNGKVTDSEQSTGLVLEDLVQLYGKDAATISKRLLSMPATSTIEKETSVLPLMAHRARKSSTILNFQLSTFDFNQKARFLLRHRTSPRHHSLFRIRHI